MTEIVTEPASSSPSPNPSSGWQMWRDGELVPFGDATIHVLSHAAHRGSEVFDVLRVVDTPDGPAVVGLRPHIARFDRSMELMGMASPFDVGALERAVAETVLANPGSAVVKVVAAWADIAGGTAPESFTPTVFVAALPAGDEPTPTSFLLGPAVRVKTSTMPKIPAAVLPPSLKVAASYTPALRHQIEAKAEGWDDVIFRTVEGRLAEATTQSLLVVQGEKVLAPPLDSVLDGITRRMLLDLAQHSGWAVDVRDVFWDEVESADELILNSTNRFVRPIAELDSRSLSAPGPLATSLGEQLQALVANEHELSKRWLTPVRNLG